MSCSSHPARPLRIERMGLVPYGRMLQLQLSRQRQVADGLSADTLFLLEHLPVFTTGRGGGHGNLLWDTAERRRHGVALYATGRGGDVTYHGPGQLVAYPILQLQPPEQDLRAMVWRLEEAVIATVAHFGVSAGRIDGLRGVWVGNDKLAAVGVRVSRWTSCHGVALNVDCDLTPFSGIVPCGLADRGVTSLARLMPAAPTMAAVQARLAAQLAEVFGRSPQQVAPSLLPPPGDDDGDQDQAPQQAASGIDRPAEAISFDPSARKATPCRSSYV